MKKYEQAKITFTKFDFDDIMTNSGNPDLYKIANNYGSEDILVLDGSKKDVYYLYD